MREAHVSIDESAYAAVGIEGLVSACRAAGLKDVEELARHGTGAVLSLVGPQAVIADTVREYERAGTSPDLRTVGEYDGGADRIDALTDRQREVIRRAYGMGYYEVPREASTADVPSPLAQRADRPLPDEPPERRSKLLGQFGVEYRPLEYRSVGVSAPSIRSPLESVSVYDRFDGRPSLVRGTDRSDPSVAGDSEVGESPFVRRRRGKKRGPKPVFDRDVRTVSGAVVRSAPRGSDRGPRGTF